MNILNTQRKVISVMESDGPGVSSMLCTIQIWSDFSGELVSGPFEGTRIVLVLLHTGKKVRKREIITHPGQMMQ